MLDLIRRKAYIKFELKRSVLMSLLKSPTLPFYKRQLVSYRKVSLPRKSSIVQTVNRCHQTGRKYSTLKKYGLSRFALRVKTYEGALPGLRRYS